MSCPHCERAIEGVLLDVPGVSGAKASHQDGTVQLEAEESVTGDMIREAVAEVGYEVVSP
jgi:copper chaperone CopZ